MITLLKNLCFFGVSLCFFAGPTVQAKEIRLYEQGKQVGLYKDLLKDVCEGDVFRFDDGSRYEVEKRLFGGLTTEIFVVRVWDPRPGEPERMVLRVPRNRGVFERWGVPYTDIINETIDGESELREAGVPLPKVYRSRRDQYLAVELIEHEMTFLDFLERPENVPSKAMSEAIGALEAFSRSLANFIHIDDFHAEQMVYQTKERRWVLLDWVADPIEYRIGSGLERNHPFGDLFISLLLDRTLSDERLWSQNSDRLTRWQRRLLNKAHSAIQDERSKKMPLRFCAEVFVRTIFPPRPRRVRK